VLSGILRWLRRRCSWPVYYSAISRQWQFICYLSKKRSDNMSQVMGTYLPTVPVILLLLSNILYINLFTFCCVPQLHCAPHKQTNWPVSQQVTGWSMVDWLAAFLGRKFGRGNGLSVYNATPLLS
jgi:hypothetical protein